MGNKKKNGFIRSGLLIICIVLILKNLINLPEYIQEFGMGLGISLEIVGLCANIHDMKKFKEFKRSIVKSIKRY